MTLASKRNLTAEETQELLDTEIHSSFDVEKSRSNNSNNGSSS
ncbi:hypothetical protein PRVXT_000463 [Proteinivorax tanatarense]|uniref:Uncharacterized protein n=1 Tax=Proteinivorax tanatarense TaxID=1260629 RepID=A0AAU7VMK3_9FIRM